MEGVRMRRGDNLAAWIALAPRALLAARPPVLVA